MILPTYFIARANPLCHIYWKSEIIPNGEGKFPVDNDENFAVFATLIFYDSFTIFGYFMTFKITIKYQSTTRGNS